MLLNDVEVPGELFLQIIVNLSVQTLCQIAIVNQEFSKIIGDNSLWKNKFTDHFPHRLDECDQQREIIWFNKFRDAYTEEYNGLSKDAKILFSLVKESDLAAIKQQSLTCSKLSHEMDYTDGAGLTLIDWACLKNHQALCDYFYLLAKHEIAANKDAIDSEGKTLLLWAIMCNQPLETIMLLLIDGIDVNVFHHKGLPIYFAAASGRLDLIEYFLNIGAYIDEPSVRPANVPLMAAVENGHATAVKLLLDRGANLSLELALHVAANKGYLDVLSVLLTSRQININCIIDQTTPLQRAIESGHLAVVKFLISKGADLETRYFLQDNAFLCAARYDQIEIMDFLFYSCSVNTNPNYKEALDIAVSLRNIKTVKFLLEKGFPINQANHIGWTPSHEAVSSNNVEISQLFLEYGANQYAKNNNRETVLNILVNCSQFLDSKDTLKLFTLFYLKDYIQKEKSIYLHRKEWAFSLFGQSWGDWVMQTFDGSRSRKNAAKHLLRMLEGEPTVLSAEEDQLLQRIHSNF